MTIFYAEAQIDTDQVMDELSDDELWEEVVKRKLHLIKEKPLDVTSNVLVSDLMRAFEIQDRSEFSYLLDKVYDLAEASL